MKTLKKIMVSLVIGLGSLLFLLVLSVVADGLVGARRVDAIANIVIPGGEGPDIRAYVAKPEGDGPFPAVIMIHEFFGLNESITGKADLLAKEGYLVIAPDTFRGSTTSWIPRAIYQVISTKPEDVNTDLDAVYLWAQNQPDVDTDRVAIVGFCYGGRTSLLYSLHNNRLAATVVFYGSSETDPAVLKNLPGPVLGIFGGADRSIPLEEVVAFEKGLEQAGVPHQITIYDGQPHAFVKDVEGIANDEVQSAAWNEMLEFLRNNLMGERAARGPSLVVADFDFPFTWKYYAMLAFEHAFGSAGHQMH